jgi:hypothetical protein
LESRQRSGTRTGEYVKTVLIFARFLPGSAARAEEIPAHLGVPQPGFAKVRQTGEATLKSTLFDPSSARID